MENRRIEELENEQLNNFNKNESILKMHKICHLLGLELQVGISKLEDFNPKDCKKMKLIHSAYLFFEVLDNGEIVEVNNDDYGSLCWSTCISRVKTNGKCDVFNWHDDSDINEEIENITKLLLKFNSKEELNAYIQATKI